MTENTRHSTVHFPTLFLMAWTDWNVLLNLSGHKWASSSDKVTWSHLQRGWRTTSWLRRRVAGLALKKKKRERGAGCFQLTRWTLKAVQLPTRGPIPKCLLQVQFLCAQQHLECGHRREQELQTNTQPGIQEQPRHIYQQTRKKLTTHSKIRDEAEKRRTPKVHKYTCVEQPGPASAERWQKLHSRVFCSGTSAGCWSALGKCVCSPAGAAVNAEVPGDEPRRVRRRSARISAVEWLRPFLHQRTGAPCSCLFIRSRPCDTLGPLSMET